MDFFLRGRVYQKSWKFLGLTNQKKKKYVFHEITDLIFVQKKKKTQRKKSDLFKDIFKNPQIMIFLQEPTYHWFFQKYFLGATKSRICSRIFCQGPIECSGVVESTDHPTCVF